MSRALCPKPSSRTLPVLLGRGDGCPCPLFSCRERLGKLTPSQEAGSSEQSHLGNLGRAPRLWGNLQRTPSSISSNLRSAGNGTDWRKGWRISHLDAMTGRIRVTNKLLKAQGWTDPETPRDLGAASRRGVNTPLWQPKRLEGASWAPKKPNPRQGPPFCTERNILERALPFGKLPTQNGDF